LKPPKLPRVTVIHKGVSRVDLPSSPLTLIEQLEISKMRGVNNWDGLLIVKTVKAEEKLTKL